MGGKGNDKETEKALATRLADELKQFYNNDNTKLPAPARLLLSSERPFLVGTGRSNFPLSFSEHCFNDIRHIAAKAPPPPACHQRLQIY